MRAGGILLHVRASWVSLVLIASLLSGCSSQDRDGHKFLTKGIEDTLAEIGICKLALARSQNDQVKDFARRAIKDLSDINRELVSLAQEKAVAAPTEPSRRQKYNYDHLAGLSGSAFDKAFAKYSVSGSETGVQDFRRQAEIGSDQDVRNAAAKGLKMLQIHLLMSRELAEKVRTLP